MLVRPAKLKRTATKELRTTMILSNTNTALNITVGVCKNNEMPNYVNKPEATRYPVTVNGKTVEFVGKPNGKFLCFRMNGKALYVNNFDVISGGPFVTVDRAPRAKKVTEVNETPAEQPTTTPAKPSREELLAMTGKQLEELTGLKLNGKPKATLVSRYLAS